VRLLIESQLVRVFDITCWAPRSDYTAMEFNTVAQLGLLRRGAYVVERCGETAVIDTNTALLLGPEDEYRVSHPTDHGDVGTVFAFAPQLLEDAIGGVGGRVASLLPSAQLAACVVTSALSEREPDQLEAEEATLFLLASLAPALAGRAGMPGDSRLGPAQRLRIERARALLASSPARRWNLGILAQALGCSPFHLSRQFRAVTGETVSRYLLRLRLAIALERLADGERDIAGLAVALGFTHHSHLSARFRSMFGITPTQARSMLTRRNLSEFRTLTAPTSSSAQIPRTA
jgi:AraC family transcriptional regulator